MKSKTALLIALLTVCVAYGNRATDSQAVREILDQNGLRGVKVDNVTSWVNDRVVGLALSDKGIRTIPAAIGELTELRMLYLDDNRIASLPAEIGNLRRLTYLRISGNRLTTLPETIGRLAFLQNLDASHNRLNSLPAGIGNLVALLDLRLSHNELKVLPKEIGGLNRLRQLRADHNRIIYVAPQIGELRSLTHLVLGSNHLYEFPEGIAELADLTWLYLNNNHISELPPSVGKLQNLSYCYLNDNRLSSLPAAIGSLRSLNRLHLDHNRLEKLPAEIAQLSSMRGLKIGHNRLCSVNAQVAGFLGSKDGDWRARQSCNGKPVPRDRDPKVTICHVPPGNPANAHEITIGAPAVAAHLRHGDILGECPSCVECLEKDKEDAPPVEEKVEPKKETDTDCMPVVSVLFDPDQLNVAIQSTKDLSNVVLSLEGGVHQKFDGLSGVNGRFKATGVYAGKKIIGVWVKSGCNKSGDGPGYGEYFNNPHYTKGEDEGADEAEKPVPEKPTPEKPAPETKPDQVVETEPSTPEEPVSDSVVIKTLLEKCGVYTVPVEEVATIEDGKVKCLDLSDKNLEELPGEIADLEELEVLDLADNELRELPPEVCELPELEKLDLSGNELEELPAEICSLENLKELDLADNQLEEVPPELNELPELEKTDLSGNPIEEPPQELGAEECPEGEECSETGEKPKTAEPLRKVPAKIGVVIEVVKDCPPQEVLDSLEQELENMRAHEAVYVKQDEVCTVCEDVKEWLDEQEPEWEDSLDCGNAGDAAGGEPMEEESRDPEADSGEEPAEDENVAQKQEPEKREEEPEQKQEEEKVHDKVVICHVPPGNPENAHTIEIAPSAVPAHLKHGDYLGPCDCEKEANKKQKRFTVDSLAVREILDKNGLGKVAVDDVIKTKEKPCKEKPGKKVKEEKEKEKKPEPAEEKKAENAVQEQKKTEAAEGREVEEEGCEQDSPSGNCVQPEEAENGDEAEEEAEEERQDVAEPEEQVDDDEKHDGAGEKPEDPGSEKAEHGDDAGTEEKPENERRVVGLDLTGRGVADLSPAVGVLDGLEELELDDNRLTTLPEEVAELEDLEDLSVDNNRIDSLSQVVETFVSSLDSAWEMVQNREVNCVTVTVGAWDDGQGKGRSKHWTALADSMVGVSVVIRAEEPSAGKATIAKEKPRARNKNGKRIKAADITATKGLEDATSDIEVTMHYSEDELGGVVEDALAVYVLNRTKTQIFTYVPTADEVEIHPAYIKEDPAYAGLLQEMLQGMAKEVHTAGVWEKVEGTVDTAANTVVFNVSEYGTYGLFADSGAATAVITTVQPQTYKTGIRVNAVRGRYNIVFTLAKSQDVRITLFNLEGRHVRNLVSGPYSAGRHRVVWSGMNNCMRPVSPGLYILMMKTAEGRFVRELRGIR